jgi:formyltetrahydrofolate deformylase
MNKAILLISCPDQKKVTASVSGFVAENDGNILHADQHIDDQTNTFFMRMEWSLQGFRLSKEAIQREFRKVAERFRMDWHLYFTDEVPKAALFVSKHLHCLYDVLLRHQAGQLSCEIPLIISNHALARKVAENFGIRFAEFPVNDANKAEQEQKQLKLLQDEKVDLIILARYHQVLSKSFVDQYANRIINIHHSFLPAFAGKSPYAQAYRKGVKIIGATSHYVTEELDQGPIIEQDTVRVSHRDALDNLVHKGQDLERMVLSRAIRWHLEHKILCYGNKTVVFD